VKFALRYFTTPFHARTVNSFTVRSAFKTGIKQARNVHIAGKYTSPLLLIDT
jgi:hypothetical protein